MAQKEAQLAAKVVPVPLVVVSAGKGGVGVSTLCAHLAQAVAEKFGPGILLELQAGKDDLATFFQCKPKFSLSAVAAGRVGLEEAAVAVAGGVFLLAGQRDAFEIPHHTLVRVVGQASELGIGNWIIADCGTQLTAATKKAWELAAAALVVMTTEKLSLVDAYMATKLLLGSGTKPALISVVNKAEDIGMAEQFHQRFAEACSRFLGRRVNAAITVPFEQTAVWACPEVATGGAKTPFYASVRNITKCLAPVLLQAMDAPLAESIVVAEG